MSGPDTRLPVRILAFLLAAALPLPSDSVRAEPFGSAVRPELVEGRTSTLRTQAGLESSTKSDLEATLNAGLEEEWQEKAAELYAVLAVVGSQIQLIKEQGKPMNPAEVLMQAIEYAETERRPELPELEEYLTALFYIVKGAS